MAKPTAPHVEVLKELYISFNTPVDQFATERDVLLKLIGEFNKKVNGDYSPDEMFAFMMNQRKSGKWPRIRRNYNGRNVKRAS